MYNDRKGLGRVWESSLSGEDQGGHPGGGGLTLSDKGWVRHGPGRWLRVNEGMPGGGPRACERMKVGIMRCEFDQTGLGLG